MKKIILILTALIACLNSAEATPKLSGTVSIKIARPKKDCKQGLWVCEPAIDIKLEAGRAIKATVQDNQNGTITIFFYSPLPESGTSFFAESDEIVFLDKNIAKALGHNSIKIIPGSYKISNATSGNFGNVTIKAEIK
jgi:hypothetical protein